jgi:hypothetical protein
MQQQKRGIYTLSYPLAELCSSKSMQQNLLRRLHALSMRA